MLFYVENTVSCEMTRPKSSIPQTNERVEGDLKGVRGIWGDFGDVCGHGPDIPNKPSEQEQTSPLQAAIPFSELMSLIQQGRQCPAPCSSPNRKKMIFCCLLHYKSISSDLFSKSIKVYLFTYKQGLPLLELEFHRKAWPVGKASVEKRRPASKLPVALPLSQTPQGLSCT